jgi:hypothetical protein
MSIFEVNLLKFRNFIGVLARFQDQATIKLSPNGMRTMVTDFAYLSILDAQFKPEFFQQYHVTESTSVTFNVRELAAKLRKWDGGVTISLDSINPNSKKCKTAVFSNPMGWFEVPVFEPRAEKTTPQFQTKYTYVMSFKEFLNDVEVCRSFGSDIFFDDNIHGDGVTIVVTGSRKKSNGVVGSRFSTAVLLDRRIKDCSKLFKKCRISVGVDDPILVQSTDLEFEEYNVFCVPLVGSQKELRMV